MIYSFGVEAEAGLPAEALAKAGRSIPVVQVLWEHLDWVQFPAARPWKKMVQKYIRKKKV